MRCKVARAFSPSLEFSSAAWERPRIRRSTMEMSCPTARAAKPNCPTSLAVKPVAQFRVLHARTVLAEALRRLECSHTKSHQGSRARHHAHAERPQSGKQRANGTLCSLERIL
jgi:hypothetical protein